MNSTATILWIIMALLFSCSSSKENLAKQANSIATSGVGPEAESSSDDHGISPPQHSIMDENTMCSEDEHIITVDGLCWNRCAYGQVWQGGQCSGKARELMWKQAKQVCPKGYRPPTRKEFVSLLEDCNEQVLSNRHGRCKPCKNSKECLKVFANESADYWTSTEVVDAPTGAWLVSLATGQVIGGGKQDRLFVRCVLDRKNIEQVTDPVPN